MREDRAGSRRIVVDGETFVVHEERRGVYHLDWATGPNPGYGLSVSSSDRSAMDDAALEGCARNFLAQVDPATGYIEDGE